MKILAIETSCDETSIAILTVDNGFKILSNIVSSQVKIHAPYGGVVPTLAKREHQKNLVTILKEALFEAGLFKNPKSEIRNPKQIPKYKIQTFNKILEREYVLLKKLLPFLKKYQKPKIDLIAVTNGPGLEPALWVGVNFAKALGYFWDLPIMPINHVEGHIIANWLTHEFNSPIPPLKIRGGAPSLLQREGWGELFPIISLVVSGGHTQLILMRDFGEYKILGETRDDAAGEAFDKLAKMLNLGYPGGPIVSKSAQSLDVRRHKIRDVGRHEIEIRLPRPMIASKNYDFSFSGLKTAALYFVKTLDKETLKKLTPAICAEFQQAIVDVLVSKTLRAAKEFNAKTILLSGGVAANDLLRETLKSGTENLKSPTPPLPLSKRGRAQGGSPVSFFVPPKNFCTDNAAMVALTAAFKLPPERVPRSGTSRRVNLKKYNWQKIKVNSNLRLK